MEAPRMKLTGEIVMKFSGDEPGYICVDDLPVAEHARCVFGRGNETFIKLGQGTVTVVLDKPKTLASLPGQRTFLEGDYGTNSEDPDRVHD